MDAGMSLLARLSQDQLGHRARVVDRHRVRHAGHAGEAASRRGQRAAGHRFLPLLARLAQVHVHVDEARTDHEARQVDDLDAAHA
jgi:hypothetical protein